MPRSQSRKTSTESSRCESPEAKLRLGSACDARGRLRNIEELVADLDAARAVEILPAFLPDRRPFALSSWSSPITGTAEGTRPRSRARNRLDPYEKYSIEDLLQEESGYSQLRLRPGKGERHRPRKRRQSDSPGPSREGDATPWPRKGPDSRSPGSSAARPRVTTSEDITRRPGKGRDPLRRPIAGGAPARTDPTPKANQRQPEKSPTRSGGTE